jgi:hypothetical protein
MSSLLSYQNKINEIKQFTFHMMGQNGQGLTLPRG